MSPTRKSPSNLGHCYSALNRHEDALPAAEESTTLSRQFATADPAAFTPDLELS